LPKPFNLAILIARIESLLRRKKWSQDSNAPAAKSTRPDGGSPETYNFEDKLVDFQNLRLHSGDKIFQLTLMETELFRYLIRNSGHAVSRKAILEDVWIYMRIQTRAPSTISSCVCVVILSESRQNLSTCLPFEVLVTNSYQILNVSHWIESRGTPSFYMLHVIGHRVIVRLIAMDMLWFKRQPIVRGP